MVVRNIVQGATLSLVQICDKTELETFSIGTILLCRSIESALVEIFII